MGETLSYTNLSYANYQGRFDIVYPEVDNKFFNSYLQEKIRSLGKIEVIEKAQKEINLPENRFKYATSLWTDITFFSDRYISGIITKQDSWSNYNKRESFTIDLKKIN